MRIPIATLVRVIALLVSGLILMPAPSQAEQLESPVTCDETAEPLGLSYGDHTEGCAINPPGDIDRFEFVGAAGDQIRINVLAQSLSFAPLLEIYCPNLVKLAEESCTTNYCSISLDLTLPQSGSCTIFVSDVGNNNAGNYTLQLERIVPVPVSVHLDYDSSTIDVINPATDVDFYSFHATPGTEIRFNVLATSLSFAPVVEIRDPNGTLVVDGVADGASCNTNYCSFTVDLLPALSGDYSLLIYDLNTNNPGGYQLSLWCLVGPCDSNGDGIPDADPPMVSYVTPVVDAISPAVDGDIYTFTGKPGTGIRLNVLAQSLSFAPVVEIRDPNGILVVDGVPDGAGCSTNYCSFSVDLSPALSGSYSLLIYDLNTNNPGNYQLSLWCLAGDCDSDADGVVDGKGPVVGYGGAATEMNSIAPAVDGDQFIFGGTAGDIIRFNVLAKSLSFAPCVEIRDPNDAVVINGLDDGACCSTNYCSFSVDLSPALTGTYSLLVYDLNTNNPGNYDVSLQCLLGACSDATPICGDNCIDVANGPLILDPGGNSQRDTDGDGYGSICDPDFDSDLTVNAADLAYMKTHFFTGDPNADLDGNGVVQAADLAILKKMFFGPPGPSCPEP